jgi:hypothetical protein
MHPQNTTGFGPAEKGFPALILVIFNLGLGTFPPINASGFVTGSNFIMNLGKKIFVKKVQNKYLI